MTLLEMFLSSALVATAVLAAVWIWSLYRFIDEIMEIMERQADVTKGAVDLMKKQEKTQ